MPEIACVQYHAHTIVPFCQLREFFPRPVCRCIVDEEESKLELRQTAGRCIHPRIQFVNIGSLVITGKNNADLARYIGLACSILPWCQFRTFARIHQMHTFNRRQKSTPHSHRPANMRITPPKRSSQSIFEPSPRPGLSSSSIGLPPCGYSIPHSHR